MLDEKNQTGASRQNPNDQLKEEILDHLANWRQNNDLEGQDFGGVVLSAVLSHIHQTDGVECRIQFSQYLAGNAHDTLLDIVDVLRRDAKTNKRLH